MTEPVLSRILQNKQPRQRRIRDIFRDVIRHTEFGPPGNWDELSPQEKHSLTEQAIETGAGFYTLGSRQINPHSGVDILKQGARTIFSRIPLVQFLRSYPDFRGGTKDTIPLKDYDYSKFIQSIEDNGLPIKKKPKEKNPYETLLAKTKPGSRERRELEEAHRRLHHIPHVRPIFKTRYRYRPLYEREGSAYQL